MADLAYFSYIYKRARYSMIYGNTYILNHILIYVNKRVTELYHAYLGK